MRARTQIGKVVYTARIHTTGARDHGVSRSSDGHLDVNLAKPSSVCFGTNAEQLLAAGWSASFESAIARAARKSQVALGEVTIDAEVDLHLADSSDYFLSARLVVSLPGVDRRVARDLVRQSMELCPFSKATQGNIEVTFKVL